MDREGVHPVGFPLLQVVNSWVDVHPVQLLIRPVLQRVLDGAGAVRFAAHLLQDKGDAVVLRHRIGQAVPVGEGLFRDRAGLFQIEQRTSHAQSRSHSHCQHQTGQGFPQPLFSRSCRDVHTLTAFPVLKTSRRC